MTKLQDHRRRSFWLKTLHEWHWVSSALCLLGMLLFAVTGITLNHAGQIESKPRVLRAQAQAPQALQQALSARAQGAGKRSAVPPELAQWAHAQWGVSLAGREAEWADDEVYVSLPRSGGDAWLRLGLQDGEAEYESTDRGWIAYLNDLHKGRNGGKVWYWFIDVFAVACVIFSITGLALLWLHARGRPSTWPIVALGLLVPVVIALLFIH